MHIPDLFRFYHPGAASGATVELDAEEAKHARVLRFQAGDEMHLVDGKGKLFSGKAFPAKRRFEVSELTLITKTERPAHTITLAVAPTKNTARFEWVIEKAVELGIGSIVPLVTEHSERSTLRLDRLERIALSAMKQSKSLWMAEISALQPFQTYLDGLGDNAWIAHCHDELPKQSVRELIALPSEKEVVLLVGPEGDFSSEEVKLALQNGCKGLDLGPKRLRTETAAIAVAIAAALMRA
ncbi:MAG: RsmE family RNA methyltransferase [Cryomorphaceae bacterium]